MLETYNRLPSYLKRYCALQSYESYTAQDHAVWRHALKQLTNFLSKHAVEIYLRGLRETGITLERIPRIEDIDKAMSNFGWGAIAVEGFIPPKTFLEFQAKRVLPIAADIRCFANLTYTPAPDIIHEAAGHAPIIANREYAEYLTRYADLAQKAIFSDNDIRLYEAIRYLSDVKEMRGVSQATITQAQQRLDAVVAEKSEVSEAARVARLYWWTAEYGLVGSLDSPRIYGAGLLSSVMECRSSLAPKTKKLPLTLEAVETAYDITEPQPQLFVAKNFADLHDILSQVEKTMSFCNGGLEGLRRAKVAQTVNTCQLDSGIQISGKIEHYEQSDDTLLLRFTGECQFATEYQQLISQGCFRHPDGCLVLVGNLEKMPSKKTWQLSADDLQQLGICIGNRVSLRLRGGYTVEGVVLRWYRQGGHLLYITWGEGKVSKGSQVLHAFPDAEYDMALGSKVCSVFGGPASREDFGSYPIGDASTKPRGAGAYSEQEKRLFSLYQRVADWRKSLPPREQELKHVLATIQQEFPEQWLLAEELLEIAEQQSSTFSASLLDNLRKLADAGVRQDAG